MPHSAVNRPTVRFLTEYSGIGGSTRMIVHLAGLLAETFGCDIRIHYREHGDPFLNEYFRFRFRRLAGRGTIHPHRSTGEAMEALSSQLEGGPLVAHLPMHNRAEDYQRLRRLTGTPVLWNLEVPSRHAYRDRFPEWLTVVYLATIQAVALPDRSHGRMVRIPVPFETVERRAGKAARLRGRTVGMVSSWSEVKGILESFAAFRTSGARRLRFWTRAPLRRRVKWWLRDRRFRFHAPAVDLSEIYSGFDCLLHLQPRSMGESNVIRDCLSIGTPCVLSDIPGHRAYADLPGVALVDRNDPGRAATAIDRMLDEEPELRSRIRKAFAPRLPDNDSILNRWGELLGLA